MTRRRRRKCLNCGRLFRPDPRNVHRLKYCSEPPCTQGQKVGQPGALAGQTAEPGLLLRTGAYRAGAGVAGGQSRLFRPEAACATRSLIDASN